MTRALTVLGLAAGLAACSELDHTNPYDPATPPDQQARAILAGEIGLEPGPVAPSLAGIRVSIPGTSLGADTDVAGRYAITGVPAGTFALQAVAPGYVTGTLTGIVVTLDDGGHALAVPAMTLALARGAVTGSGRCMSARIDGLTVVSSHRDRTAPVTPQPRGAGHTARKPPSTTTSVPVM